MDDVSLQLERSHWTANAPGVGDCVQTSNQQNWAYGLAFSSVHNDGGVASWPDFTRHAASGDLYAVSSIRLIVKSIDNGATWANNLAGAPLDAAWQGHGIITLTNDTLIAFGFTGTTGSGAVVRSVNNGGAWTDESEATMELIDDGIQTTAGTIILTGLQNGSILGIWRSIDNGATFNLVYSSSLSSQRSKVVQAANGDLIVLGQDLSSTRSQVYRSSDDGATWLGLGDFASNGGPERLMRASDSNLYLLPGSSFIGPVIYKSITNGTSWLPLANIAGSSFNNMIETSTPGEFYAVADKDSVGADPTELWRSTDYGLTWQLLGQVSGNAVMSIGIGLYQNNDGRLFVGTRIAGVGADIFRSDVPATVSLGRETTCTTEVLIANNYHYANLTHIFIDDGGVFSANLFPAALPLTLFPAFPANNDALYFGIKSSVIQGGPFNNLAFDLSTVMAGIYTLTWEYYNGAAWATLTTTDNTISLSNPGVHSLHWTPPSNWATTIAVNGVIAWWVRARLSNISGAVVPPVQQNRNIYVAITNTITTPTVSSDIAALAQLKLTNLSDLDGPGGNAPNLFDNRIVVGLRSVGLANFVANLNLSDKQQSPGITVAVGTNATFDDDILAPTGRRATYNPGGVEAMATRATISLSSTVARDFYGVFHAFLRAKRTAGAATDLSVRLQVATGSGGISFTSISKQLQSTTAFEVLDFGEIALPVSSAFKSTDLADTTEIRLQASAASGVPDLYLYDLILIPVDEWAIDAVDKANESDSDVGRSNGIGKLLDIDSITDPRFDIKTLIRTADASGFVTAEYNPITNGPAILQSNVAQRLWFLAMQTSTTGAAYNWIAPPEIVHSIQLWANPRYLAMRGSR